METFYGGFGYKISEFESLNCFVKCADFATDIWTIYADFYVSINIKWRH